MINYYNQGNLKKSRISKNIKYQKNILRLKINTDYHSNSSPSKNTSNKSNKSNGYHEEGNYYDRKIVNI